ncbi:protein IWS1 homolog A-like isoform X5 [Hypomesus transpacificus]|uniref:protein IWS1 homolog A-like isoform X5 n=1 Tax=Hypomesus transpacificus TaxID=137520 RepID=UPI001F074B2C|nr:protein IWS1 homolog A-like isoform X5 [Hypomesus transpacificus]
MAIRSVILCIGVYFVFVKAADAEHGKLGGKITLVPTVKGQMDEILWKHKGNKVVEFDGSQNKEFGSYVGRTVLDFVTGELIISALTTEDSGHYELEAHINNLLKYSQHQVEVIAEVAQPTIICVLNDTKTTASMATLQCNADPQDQQSPMTYSWEGLEGTLLSSSSIDQKLSIVVKDRHDKAVFQCSVSNLVSKKQAQFQVKNCFTDESSSTVLAVCLSLLCLVILLILAVLALWFYKRHKKAEPALNKQDNVENPSEQKQVKEERKLFDRLAKQQIPTKGRLDDQNGTEPALNKQDDEDDPLLPGHVKEKGKHFERLARQQTPTKGRLDDQNGKPALNKQDDEDDPLLPRHVKEKGKHFERLARQQTPTKGRLDDQNGTEPALNKQDDEDDPLLPGHVKEKGKHFERLARQQTPTKERLDDQNGNKKQENIERTEGNSTLPSTQALPQQAQNEEKRSGPPSPSQASMIQSDQNILQPGQETVPDQDPAEPVEVSLPDQKSVVASITKEPTDPAIPDPEPEGPTCPTKQDTGAEETGNQKQPDADILGKTGLLTNPNNPTQAGSEPEAPKNQFDTNTEATSEVPAKGHQVENSESCSTSPGGEEGDKDGLKKAEKEIEPRNGETNDETNDDRIDKDAMDQNGEEAIKKTEQKKEHSSQFSTLSPKDDQINGSTLDAVAVSKPTEPSQDQPELDDSKAVRDVDLCQQKPNSQSGSISPGGVVGSEKGSKEAEEEMEAGDVEKEIPEGGGDHSIRIDGNMKTDDEENKKSFVAVGDTVAVSKPTEPSQDQPEPDDSKAVRDVDLCQQKPNSQSGSISPGGVVGSEKGSKEAEEEMEAGDVEKEIPEGGGDHSIRIDGNMKTDDEENKKSFVEVGDTVAVSKPTEPSQDQPEPDDSKAVRDVDLCQQKPNSQSGSISPGGVVGSEKGSEEAEEEMEAGDVEKEIPEGGGDHSIRIDGNMKTDDKENKKSFVEVGDTEHQSMKEEKTGTDERAEQHPDPGEKADVSSQSETVTAGVKNNADKEQDDKKDKGGIKVDSPMEGAGSDEQGDSNEEKAKGTEQGETDQKLED